MFLCVSPSPSPLTPVVLGSELNNNLHGSQLLASAVLQNTLFEEETSEFVLQHEGPYDFYLHPNIQQVRQCQHVLDNFTKEVKVLLQEWPEHPALLQVRRGQSLHWQEFQRWWAGGGSEHAPLWHMTNAHSYLLFHLSYLLLTMLTLYQDMAA